MCTCHEAASWTISVFVCQVVPRPLVWSKCREVAGCTRRVGDLPGQRVTVQTWRLCSVSSDGWEDQKWRKAGLPHQDNVSGGPLSYVCFSMWPCVCGAWNQGLFSVRLLLWKYRIRSAPNRFTSCNNTEGYSQSCVVHYVIGLKSHFHSLMQ